VIEPKDLPPEVLGSTPEWKPGAQPAEKPDLPRQEWTGDADRPSAAAYPSEAPALPAQAVGAPGDAGGALPSPWESGLEAEALALLVSGRSDVWDVLTRRFESRLIMTALANTHGRRIEAAHKLGIGRNTITRKIQELNLE
jgi:two-component system nitrogen regulation response regulator GlnG